MMMSSKPSTRRKGSPVFGLSSRGSSCGFFGWRGSEWEKTVDVMTGSGEARPEVWKEVSGFKYDIAEAMSQW
jgi:hypothetical protein